MINLKRESAEEFRKFRDTVTVVERAMREAQIRIIEESCPVQLHRYTETNTGPALRRGKTMYIERIEIEPIGNDEYVFHAYGPITKDCGAPTNQGGQWVSEPFKI